MIDRDFLTDTFWTGVGELYQSEDLKLQHLANINHLDKSLKKIFNQYTLTKANCPVSGIWESELETPCFGDAKIIFSLDLHVEAMVICMFEDLNKRNGAKCFVRLEFNHKDVPRILSALSIIGIELRTHFNFQRNEF